MTWSRGARTLPLTLSPRCLFRVYAKCIWLDEGNTYRVTVIKLIIEPSKLNVPIRCADWSGRKCELTPFTSRFRSRLAMACQCKSLTFGHIWHNTTTYCNIGNSYPPIAGNTRTVRVAKKATFQMWSVARRRVGKNPTTQHFGNFGFEIRVEGEGQDTSRNF